MRKQKHQWRLQLQVRERVFFGHIKDSKPQLSSDYQTKYLNHLTQNQSFYILCFFPQLNQEPDQRPSNKPSHVGRSRAASYETEPSSTRRHTPLTHTVLITHIRRTHIDTS